MHEIARWHEKNGSRAPLFGITGCMVRKTGMAKRYLTDNTGNFTHKNYRRHGAEKITLLAGSDGLANYDDALFLRSELIDFTLRIEEVSFLTKILSLIL